MLIPDTQFHCIKYVIAVERVNILYFFQTVNFDLCRAYLDLITTYVSIMIMICRVDDRKAVLALFSVAYEILHHKT